MRWVLDSNVWIEAAAGVPHAKRAFAKAVAIEVVTRNTADFKKVVGLSVRDTRSF